MTAISILSVLTPPEPPDLAPPRKDMMIKSVKELRKDGSGGPGKGYTLRHVSPPTKKLVAPRR